jgi:hypothetical protein
VILLGVVWAPLALVRRKGWTPGRSPWVWLAADEMVRLDAFALGHDAAATRGERLGGVDHAEKPIECRLWHELACRCRRREAMEKDDAAASM